MDLDTLDILRASPFVLLVLWPVLPDYEWDLAVKEWDSVLIDLGGEG